MLATIKTVFIDMQCGCAMLVVLFAFLCFAAAGSVPHGMSGILKLQDYTKISHDTYYLSRKRHPQNPDQFVHGYAFLNLHTNARKNLPSAKMIHREKHDHFQRSILSHESAHPIDSKRLGQSLPSCTGPISDGTSWKVSRGYNIHTQNRNALTSAFIIDAIQKASDAWRCGTSDFEKLIDGGLLSVIDGSSGEVIDLEQPDGLNEIGFASIQGHPGTVAVTIVWGIFDGPIPQREIIEFDMIFDGDHYGWGDGGANPNVMDLQAISTHEMGHRYGLDDIYDSSCSDVTMYGTSGEGETQKRSLHSRDVEGLSYLYGPLAPTK